MTLVEVKDDKLEIKPVRLRKEKYKAQLENKIFNEDELYLFHEGRNYNAYNFMGAHFTSENRKRGVRFTLWAPRAKNIFLVGDFSNWETKEENKLNRINETGLWSIFIPRLKEGIKYKYYIEQEDGKAVLKADPYGIYSEVRPNTASILCEKTKIRWSDKKWLNKREATNYFESPINIYELHLGSWKRKDEDEFLSYDELSVVLPKYVKEMGYTHVEFMPLNEHPLDASWGYQVTGYYSVTSRYGDIKGLKRLINALHKNDIGVILDWVPGHFCKDEQGLYMFDGTPTYEYEEKWKADNKGWGTFNFDLGKPEVKSFLISNAFYFINEFHIDGLRVDAVSNMLYLNYGRNHGEWIPNIYGGNENLEAIQFIKELNEAIKTYSKGVITIAEESTSWPNVTNDTEYGGLGFDFKWNMGWMNDTLEYNELDPIYRKYHHNKLTFPMMYNHSEKFILPISHDEVVHGKKSLIDKMQGDYWNKFANLRAYMAYMYGHPGKKLMFMGCEFGQFIEWREYEELEWKLIDKFDMHRKTHNFLKALNNFYKNNSELWELDYDGDGFQWIDADNNEQSIYIFIRKSKNIEKYKIFVCNFTPMVYYDFNIGVPEKGVYREIFNTDKKEYGGSGQVIKGNLFSKEGWCHNQPYTLTIKVPPMAVSVFERIIEESKTEEKILKEDKYI
ncbi:1,4-alpha-glucan branching protein GlgB [Clostridium perfringens]|uniref:1,4-alpha-glucan branching protein GlgB n=1 Tax=Clostridium perfringens TaxID=1502 RepID=UPI001CCA3E3C|nr:1,4-alpha-glucan branching protein GlgB [Clostridium perfringens]MDK0774788.1 1,4-alpha-glucan branching protein GlgB [Clostridium perfringens]MDK0779964.1 1,4-alpha-glucan branching protein GlgB [Clostridium perfringens]MDK0885347.1 1,4-alpha-glucan branching protein GlgB [Clostridium perfringens]MDK0940036.1 1,4-alpha-glucan branching protein GlgB [Clostridium perfringens]MDM0961848.1 1,4-alpha-glucan branching protein GlgB [Clostridium perfringens]